MSAVDKFSGFKRHVEILDAVTQERFRQEQKKAEGKFKFTCADVQMRNLERFAVLGEEFGEVARHMLGAERLAYDGGTAEDERRWLRAELVQVAAVAVAWVEGLDAEAGSS